MRDQKWLSWPIWLVVLYGFALALTAAVGTPAAPVPPAPLANLLDKPLGEDAFYMFSVARNLGTGHGISYGGIPTTGVQPLATFLYASLYWLTAQTGMSATAALRLILVVNVGLLVLTGLLSGVLVSRWLRRRDIAAPRGFWIAATIVVVNPLAFRLFGYGLETGLYLFTIVALQLAIDALPNQLKARDLVGLGVLLGLCILARLDFVVLGSVLFGWQLLTRRLRFRDAVIIAVVALLVAGPWLAYVYSVAGHIMPSSGAAEAGVATSVSELVERSWVMASAIVGSLSSVIYLPTADPVPIVLLATVLLIALLSIRPSIGRFFHENVVWIVGSAVLVVYYVLFSTAAHFYGRYLAPLWLLWTQLLAAGLALRLARTPDRLAAWVHHAGAVALVVLFAAQIGYTIHRGHAGNSHLFTAFYVREHAAELGTVGAFQSGLVGYVNDERTINLDGKLDQHALSRRGQLECYLAERGVSTVIDWPEYIDNGWIDPAFVQSHMREVGRVPGGMSVIMAVDATPTPCRQGAIAPH